LQSVGELLDDDVGTVVPAIIELVFIPCIDPDIEALNGTFGFVILIYN
jgi:hypothetical protein